MAGGGQGGAGAGEGAQREDEGDAAVEVGERGVGGVLGAGDGQPLDEGALTGAGDAAQQDLVEVGEGLVGALGRAGREFFQAGEGAILTADGRPEVPQAGERGVRARPRRPQAQIRRIQRPAVGRVGQVDAVDGQAAVLAGDVGEVGALEGGVGGARGRMPFEEGVDLGDGAVQAAALLDEGACHERRPLGEEVHDVQAGGGEQGVVHQLGVAGQAAGGVRGGGRQAFGEGAVTEQDGLYVVHGQLAEAVQGDGQGVGHGRFLVLGARALAGEGGVHRPAYEFRGEFVQVPVGQGGLFALEGDQAGDPYGRGDQPGARPVLDEQLLHERRDHAGSEPYADC